MTTVAHVTAWLEQFAPAHLAEPWDNVGLLWGDPSAPAPRVMTCLTVTPTTATEAIEEQAALIVSHHPVLFREVKKIRADMPDTGFLWHLARAGVAIVSPHTAFDNTHQGINDLLARRLGLVDVAALRPAADLRDVVGRIAAVVQSGRLHARGRARGGLERGIRSRGGPDRGVRGMLICDSRRGHLFRHRPIQPDGRQPRPPRDGRGAAARVCVPGPAACRGLGFGPRPPFVRRACDRRVSAP